MKSTLVWISGGLVLVLIACAVIIGIRMHDQLEQARDRAEVAEGDRTLAEGNLTEVQITLHATRTDLARTRRQLGRVSTQATTLSKQSHACRYLVRANDHLLSGSIAYQHATGALLKHRPHMGAAKRWIGRAHRHAVAVIALAKSAGYRSLGELVVACAPPRR